MGEAEGARLNPWERYQEIATTVWFGLFLLKRSYPKPGVLNLFQTLYPVKQK